MFDTFSRNFTFDIGVRNSVGFSTCDVFCPVCHNLYEFDRFFYICAVYHWISHVWYNRSNILHVALSANKGVRNSVGFFTCEFCQICYIYVCYIWSDVKQATHFRWIKVWEIRSHFSHVTFFCPICHNLYELGRFFHSRVVYHWISHVWHNWSNILHMTLSVNIGVRNSVGFFTCDVFCWIWGNVVEFGQTLHICEVFDRIPHVWPIKSDLLHLIFSANIGVRNSVGFFTCDVFCPICHILYEFDRFLPHMCSISLNYSRLI